MATLQEVNGMRERLLAQRDETLATALASVARIDETIAKIDAAKIAVFKQQKRVDDLIDVYVSTRDEKEAKESAHKEVLAALNARLGDIERWMYDHLTATGTESVRANTGTAFFRIETSVRVDDRDEFFAWVLENQAVDMLEARAAKRAVEAHIESTGELPPGLSRRVEKLISIRRPERGKK